MLTDIKLIKPIIWFLIESYGSSLQDQTLGTMEETLAAGARRLPRFH